MPTAMIAARICGGYCSRNWLAETTRDAELAGFGKQRVEAGIVGNEVLDLVAVQGEQLPAPAGEQGVLEFGQQQTAEGGGLLAEPPLVEVQDHPPAPVHGFEQRKRRALLAEDVAEPLVGGKARNLVENGVAVDALHRFAAGVEAGAEVVGDFGVLHSVETSRAEGGVGQQRREFQQREVVVGQHVQGVAQQFFGPRPEGIEVPAGFENLREFGELNVVLLARLGFEHVQADRELRVGGLDDDQAAH